MSTRTASEAIWAICKEEIDGLVDNWVAFQEKRLTGIDAASVKQKDHLVVEAKAKVHII